MKTQLLARASAILALLLIAGVATAAEQKSTRPNVIVILADDMGFSDAGCYGGEIPTPNLDRLAAGGLRFTQFYNTARCWPSRASILTGYYAQQVNRDRLPGGKSGGAQSKRPAWARLLPELLKPLGYRSYHSGKWHVDGPVLAGGFDHSYSLNDHDRFFNPKQHTLDDEPLPPASLDDGYYATTAITDYALKFLDKHQQQHADKPFFLYLPHIAPHFPLHALPQDIATCKGLYDAGWDATRAARFAKQQQLGLPVGALSQLQPDTYAAWSFTEEKLLAANGPGEMGRVPPWNQLNEAQKKFQPRKMEIHAAMIHRMDLEIGRLIAALKKMGVYENTLILFASDNGATSEQIIRGDLNDPAKTPGSAGTFLALGPGWSTAANTPFRYHKSWVHEGGIATPLIAHWPAGIAARGELRNTPGHLIDLPPTIIELAGGKMPTEFRGENIPPVEGRSLVPAFAKDGTVNHDFLWWCHDNNRAIRVGDWKLVADQQKPWELFNLATDRSETKNLAAENPSKVRELEALWNEKANRFHADSELMQAPVPATGKKQGAKIQSQK